MTTTTNMLPAAETLKKGATVHILIVDSSTESIASLQRILEKEGRTIIKAHSCDEALKIALEQPIGLILLDAQMPGTNIIGAAKTLRSNPTTKDITIIFAAAAGNENKSLLDEFEEGTVDILLKPFDEDITRSKVAVFEKLYIQQEALKEKTVSLTALNKQMNEFVYIISHDLKAPLRGIASLASFIEDDMGANPNPAVTETLNMLKSRCNRMQNLIDAILHYSRIGNANGAQESVDLNELLKDITELIITPPHIKVTIQENMPTVTGEKTKLHEIFQNLIGNGIKYNNKEEGTVHVSYQDRGDSYEFAITDNGVGIKEEHYEKIFGIFQTLQPKDKVESTGIGLTIVKKLVEQNGGKVTVESKLGEGSTFKFTWKK